MAREVHHLHQSLDKRLSGECRKLLMMKIQRLFLGLIYKLRQLQSFVFV